MSAFSLRCETAGAVRAGFVLFVSAVAVMGSGCANTSSTYPSDAVSARVAEGPVVPMESDGLPVQAAPSSQIRQVPDDPSQPFSPNYGGTNPASKLPSWPTVKASNDGPSAPLSIPDDLPPAFRKQLLAAREASG